MNSRKRVLVLPAAMPAAQQFYRAHAGHYDMVAASSERADAVRCGYRHWEFLPHITDPAFATAMRSLLNEQRIDAIFCAHQVIWAYLAEGRAGAVELLNPPPIPSLMEETLHADSVAAAMQNELRAFYGVETLPSRTQLAALYRRFLQVPGECDVDKLLLLLVCALQMPAGDVVEIGSLWGRSAYTLAWLSHFRGSGALLCIDPWSQPALRQHSPDDLLYRYSTQLADINVGFQLFCQNLLSGGFSQVNYLRCTSAAALPQYQRERCVRSEEFGETATCGRIALLHIDGNHDEAVVRADVEQWTPLVLPGGWIVIDDYTWRFGDGPRLAGDDLLLALGDRVACAFVLGGALAIQLATH